MHTVRTVGLCLVKTGLTAITVLMIFIQTKYCRANLLVNERTWRKTSFMTYFSKEQGTQSCEGRWFQHDSISHS